MKTAIRCDAVFEHLTRGPFPAADAQDAAMVEAHLHCCHECRQLAEALRPGRDLVHEALAAEERVGLPAYYAADDPDQAEVRSIMEQIDGCAPPSPVSESDSSSRAPRNLRAAAGWILAAAAALVMFALSTQRPAAESALVAQGGKRPAVQLNPQGMTLLRDLRLASICWPVRGVEPAPQSLAELRFACCTRCHSSGNPQATLSEPQSERLWSSCRACHLQLALQEAAAVGPVCDAGPASPPRFGLSI